MKYNCGHIQKDWRGRRKNLIIIGGGVLQLQTLFECNELGLGKILVDKDPQCWCARSPYFNSDYFVKSQDFHDPQTVLSDVKRFLSKHKDIVPVGVYTQGCDAAYTVAYVAKGLGLPSIGVDVAYRSHNKIAMRQAFKKYGIPQPDFRVDEVDDLPFPVVFKSTDNCASRGLTIVRHADDINQAIVNARMHSSDRGVIVEEFIEGEEYSVDTVVYKGVVYPAGISDRVFTNKETYAVQNGSITPSFLDANTQQRMYWIMQDCADALGIKWGALKGDLIVNGSRIYVLEVTARLSGGFDSQYRKPYSYGVNLIKATIDLACGKKLDFNDIIPKWVKFSQTFTIFPKEGILKEIKGVEETRKIPGIKQLFIVKDIGDRISFKTCADRVVHIVACCDTYAELQDTINKTKETLKIITE